MTFCHYAKDSILICAVALFAGTAGAADVEPNSAGSNTTAPFNIEGAASANDVAVTVNGVEITEPQVEAAIDADLQRMAAGGARIPPSMREQVRKQMRAQIVDRMIVDQLLNEQIQASNMVITTEDVIEYLRQSGAQQQPPLSLEDIKALVEARGQNFEEMVRQLKDSKQMRYQKLMEMQFEGKVDVNEADAKKYYSENPSEFNMPEQVRVSQILILPDTPEPNADPNRVKANAKATAETLLKQIKKDGADFATLAKAKSQHATAKNGGDMGFFTRGENDPAFDKAAFDLKVGQVSDVVETRFGYHIIRLTDRRDAQVIAFAESRDKIIDWLKQQKQREIIRQYVDSLKEKAKIVYPPGKEPDTTTPMMIRPR